MSLRRPARLASIYRLPQAQLILFEAASPMQVHSRDEHYGPTRLGDARQFVEGMNRGVAGGERSRASYRVEGVGFETQLLPKGHLAELFVEVLSAGLPQHSPRKVHGVEVLAPPLRQDLTHQTDAGPRVEKPPPVGTALRTGRLGLQAVPGLGQVSVVLGGSLVVAHLHLLVGGAGVYPLDPVMTVLHVTSGR